MAFVEVYIFMMGWRLLLMPGFCVCTRLYSDGYSEIFANIYCERIFLRIHIYLKSIFFACGILRNSVNTSSKQSTILQNIILFDWDL